MVSASGDFRDYLQGELVRRCRANPQYSLRAFARQLQIESSALSKILSGKRGVSRRMLDRMGLQLGLGPHEMGRFETTRLAAPPELPPSAREFRQLTLDTFELISHWYYYALLELTKVEGFSPRPKWIARCLGLTVTEVKIAAERLRRLGMLEVTGDGNWIDRSGAVTTVGNEFTAVAFRRLQRDVLEKALAALETVPIAERDQSSMTMAINTRLLPEAKRKVRRFRRHLCDYLKSRPPCDEVYHLGISLYPVSSARKGARK